MGNGRYQGRYRIESTRLPWWDYGSNAAYFITICAQDRAHVFGEVVGGAMILTPLGRAAWDCWRAMPQHFPFAVPDAFVAMPNHVHGIVVIDKPAPDPPLGRAYRRQGNTFGPQSRNLASIVRGFKVGVTMFARRHQLPFAWQPRYHDHIVRDDAARERIRRYIADNPRRWRADRFYP